jgi:hypothetical protein
MESHLAKFRHLSEYGERTFETAEKADRIVKAQMNSGADE